MRQITRILHCVDALDSCVLLDSLSVSREYFFVSQIRGQNGFDNFNFTKEQTHFGLGN